MKTFTADELTVIILPDHRHTLNTWLNRGDGVAIYRNLTVGPLNSNEYKFLSYGSKACMLATETPPKHLPDMHGIYNAGFELQGVYYGEPLGE